MPFDLQVEDRIQCTESRCVSYKRSSTNVLGLDIPLQAATNMEELEDFQVSPPQPHSPSLTWCLLVNTRTSMKIASVHVVLTLPCLDVLSSNMSRMHM